MKTVSALAAVALLAMVATPTASAYPCIPTEPDCETVDHLLASIEFQDCPAGSIGPSVWVLGIEVVSCIQ